MDPERRKAVVTRVDPRRERQRLLLLVLALLAVGGIGFMAGLRFVEEPVVPLADEADPLRDEITRLATRARIDRATIATLREDTANARAQIEELERELVFYREVLAPEERGAALLLREPTLIAGDTPGAWRYQLVVQQGARTDSARRGTLRAIIEGDDSEGDRQYSIADLDGARDDDALPLNFRYFQKFEGELQLPVGFTPRALLLQVTLTRPADVVTERRFAWPGTSPGTSPIADRPGPDDGVQED